MDSATSTAILERARQAREKRADPSGDAFADAVQQMSASQLRSDALHDVGNVGLTALGVGAAGRGLVGLIGLLRRAGPKKPRSGPALLPLPYPVEPEEAPRKALRPKLAGFLAGDAASTTGGIPWYYPATVAAGLTGLAGGWKGLDYVLNSRRKTETRDELDKARQEFHDALMGQYAGPAAGPEIKLKKTAEELTTMEKVGAALDRLYDQFQTLLAQAEEKQAFDLTNAAGAAVGGYGVYAGLSGLLTGAMVYNKIQKRNRRAILEKALQSRQRKRFLQSPTEIYAVPEPVTHRPTASPSEEAKLVTSAPEE